MDSLWQDALWQQFSAALAMFENALVACPATLWRESLWRVPDDNSFPPEFAEFWHIAYHTLFWFDLYLAGGREENFRPPAPFIWTELDPPVSPARPYTKEELLTYLAATRQKCHDQLLALTDERARQIVEYPWSEGRPVSYLELQLYSMRHVQEHAAQLNLWLGQHDIPDISDWVCRDETDGD